MTTKLVAISQEGQTVTLRRYVGKENDAIVSFDFDSIDSQQDNAALVEDFRKHGNAILQEPSLA